nr:hypothetical protein [Tanacetum cinerariifolium]
MTEKATLDCAALDEYMDVWFRSKVTDAVESHSFVVIFHKELEEWIENRRLLIAHLEKGCCKCIRQKRETMEWLTKCAELEMAVGSQRFRRETICACEDMVSFVQELKSLSEVTVTIKMAKFLNETMAKDDGRVLQLHNLERELDERAVEKQCFAQKLLRGESI